MRKNQYSKFKIALDSKY